MPLAPPLQSGCASSKGALGTLLNTDVAELARMGIEHDVDITQAVFLADMGEHHAAQLEPAFEVPGPIITVVLVHDALGFIARQQT